jgi:hypothetical protein
MRHTIKNFKHMTIKKLTFLILICTPLVTFDFLFHGHAVYGITAADLRRALGRDPEREKNK